jgi:tRNA pseudouridine38-40 synthase
MMRTIKLTIEFDGTNYYGWQIQREEPTVQQVLRKIISMVLDRPIVLHGSGRTDSGVHALAQVAHFVTDADMDVDILRKAVNRLIPKDMVIKQAEEVDAGFNARFSAKSRTYWYLVWNSYERSAFFQRYAWYIPAPLDIAAMKKAAACLIGVHDFTSFQGTDRENGHAVREVHSVYIKKTRQHLIIFSITANAFVKHMVRNIVGTLVDVGKGKISTDGFQTILIQKDRNLAGMNAPPHGLFLKSVNY